VPDLKKMNRVISLMQITYPALVKINTLVIFIERYVWCFKNKPYEKREVKFLLLNIFHSCQHLRMLDTTSIYVHRLMKMDSWYMGGMRAKKSSQRLKLDYKITNILQDFAKRI